MAKADNNTALYADIKKFEPQDDGTLLVTGIASTGTRDSAGEIITADCMRAALPDYMKWGAVREMHQLKAAGTAVEATVNDDGETVFVTKVVDPMAITKVKAGVYKGFSIGGKVLERDAADETIITKMRWVETSLVDRPCNPDAAITLFRAEDNGPLAKEAISPENGDVKKSLWNAVDVASLLAQAKSIQTSIQFDAAFEGETDPAVAKMETVINLLSEIVQEMLKNETGAGAGSDTDNIVTAADKLAAALGDKGAQAVDVKKALSEALTEVLAPVTDAFAKATTATAEAFTALGARLEKMEANTPAKGGPALKAIEKADDVAAGGLKTEVETLPDDATPMQKAAHAMRSTLAAGPARI